MMVKKMAKGSYVALGLLGLAALAALVCGILYLAGVIGNAPASAPASVPAVTAPQPTHASWNAPASAPASVPAVTAPQPTHASCELAAGGFCPSGLTCDRGGTPNAACVRAQTSAHVLEKTTAPTKRKQVLEYSCGGCGALGGGAHQCCVHCYEMQALASKRAPPFDSQQYRMQEVRCPQCEEIMKTKAEYCSMTSDGRFACQKGAICNVAPQNTYED